MKKQQIKAFTLVELIIVITILAILATIGFMSFQSYTNDARDGKRKSDLGELRTGLEVYQAKNAILPNPNNYVTMSGISYQGYAGITLLSKLRAGDGFQDPTDKQYYTYSINLTKDKYQLLAMLENNPNATSYNKNMINETYALDYTNRYNYSLGQNVGIYLSGTTKLPVQEGNSGTTVTVNTANISVVTSNTSNVSGGTGGAGNTPVDGICGSANGTTVATSPSTNLCTAGTASTVSGTGPWTWTCAGTNGGTNASCSATKYNVSNIFTRNNEYTITWSSNTCNTSSFTLVDLAPGQDTIPTTLNANTIYKMSSGSYYTASSRTINFGGNCIGLIGEKGTKLYKHTLNASSRSNIIIANLKTEGYYTYSGVGSTTGNSDISLGANSTVYNVVMFNKSTLNVSSATDSYIKNVMVLNGGDGTTSNYTYNCASAAGTRNVFNNFVSSGCYEMLGNNANYATFNNMYFANGARGMNSHVVNSNNSTLANNFYYLSSGMNSHFGNSIHIFNDGYFINSYHGISGDSTYGEPRHYTYGNYIWKNTSGTRSTKINQWSPNPHLDKIIDLSLSTENLNTSTTFDSSYAHIWPTKSGIYDYTRTLYYPSWFVDINGNFREGGNVPNQKRPIKYNSTTGKYEYFGIDGVDYDTSKKLGWNPILDYN